MSDNNTNASRIFIACCIALTVTAMTFGIRAGILSQLGQDFNLSNTELGWINSMAFLGFPIATILGGFLFNIIGGKKLVLLAFIGHILGLILTIYANGFWMLLISTFLIGFANGSVEAGCNPVITNMYHTNKTAMLNRFHVWFPGGIVVGALISKFMTDMSFSWQAQIAIMLIPTFIYGFLVIKQHFPEPTNIDTSIKNNVKAVFSPLFLFMAFCMTLTAASEFGTQQWIEKILGASGASPMLVLALITGIMALGRFFAGPVVNRFNTAGVLLGSAIMSTIGIAAITYVSGSMVYVAAILFALGITYFWPTMLGFVSEHTPQTGALGMSLMGAAGMFAMFIWNPIIGSWIDDAHQKAKAQNLDGPAADIAAGQAALENLVLFPSVLIVLFAILFFTMAKKAK